MLYWDRRDDQRLLMRALRERVSRESSSRWRQGAIGKNLFLFVGVPLVTVVVIYVARVIEQSVDHGVSWTSIWDAVRTAPHMSLLTPVLVLIFVIIVDRIRHGRYARRTKISFLINEYHEQNPGSFPLLPAPSKRRVQ